MNPWYFVGIGLTVINLLIAVIGACIKGDEYPMWAMMIHLGVFILVLCWINLVPIDRKKQ
jgi:hypothetical protein